MKHFLVAILMLPAAVCGQTLDECQVAAEQNYPLIKQYGLMAQTTEMTLSNIQKGWLPQISAMVQATYQSDVTAWPSQMQSMYSQMGLQMEGLRKDQYRLGIDVAQTVYDGGIIRGQKDVSREQGRVDEARMAVTLYDVRRRVNEMYFSLLLLGEQLKLNEDLTRVLAANEKKLESMSLRGTASEADYKAIRAERLTVEQQTESLQSQHRTLCDVLSAFCGIAVSAPTKPAACEALPAVPELHPEMKAADAQLRLADAQERLLDARMMPKLSVFASAFYGYPGYNMFDDMMRHRWSLNGMIGARLTWNIGALYTRKADRVKIALQRSMIENMREVFLFNNRLQQLRQDRNIARYRKLMATDDEIVYLRQSVRKAAESKLAHGITDVNDLMKEIHSENAARLQQSIHEIEMLKELYDLKLSTNN